MTPSQRIRRIERAVVAAVVDDALAAGLTIAVHDGDGFSLRRSADRNAVLAAMWATDEEVLILYDGSRHVGRVWLVYGNGGWDVIHDCTDNPRTAAVLARADRIADRLHETAPAALYGATP